MKITEELLQKITNYLATKPYNEVVQLINELVSQIKENQQENNIEE